VDCPTCPELALDEWGEELLAPLEGRRYPLGGTLELTERCNLACVHCYINQPAGDRAARARELATEEVAGLLDQISDAGCLFLLLTGGEVLLRPDFPEIYRHARQRGMLVNLFTNGTLLTPSIADLLAQSRPQSIEISLYGATPETYEAVTKVPGSYARCRQGIELLMERRLPLTLKSVLLTINHRELSRMSALAEQLGVPFRYDGTLWPRLDGGQQPFAYRLSLDELAALDSDDAERRSQWEEVARLGSGQLIRAEYVYGCGAGYRSFHVDSVGRLSACGMARRPSFDLRHVSFEEGWNEMGDLREQRRQLDTPCRTCTVGALCSQCVGWSQLIHGDDETPVSFICQLGQLRAMQIQHTHV